MPGIFPGDLGEEEFYSEDGEEEDIESEQEVAAEDDQDDDGAMHVELKRNVMPASAYLAFVHRMRPTLQGPHNDSDA